MTLASSPSCPSAFSCDNSCEKPLLATSVKFIALMCCAARWFVEGGHLRVGQVRQVRCVQRKTRLLLDARAPGACMLGHISHGLGGAEGTI